MLKTSIFVLLAACFSGLNVCAQTDAVPTDAAQPAQGWNVYYQATSIGQYHGMFHAPYQGANSLLNTTETDVSLTTTLFFTLNLSHNTQLMFDPEIAGGRGFSGVTGIANAPNGELPRVASATPKPYLARLYLSHDFALSDETEDVEADENQLAGKRPVVRYTVVVGRFTITDFLDGNRYTHDPRTQFMGWGIMFNGAWDYPADTRGYTWGWMHEFHARHWSLRYASVAEPTTPNGGRFDRRLFRDRGDEFEGEVRYNLRKHPGVLRVLNYENRSRSGNYGDAVRLGAATGTVPDIALVRKPGTLKYGFGINTEQEITKNFGYFVRLGWNDGKTEDFAFTAIDRLASGGVSYAGERWGRKKDTVATAYTAAGVSGVHALYLSRGGLDFIIGDGKLNYAPESVWESYYSAQLFKGLFATVDAQHIANPAYNHDRGPVWAYSLRLHVEGGFPR